MWNNVYAVYIEVMCECVQQACSEWSASAVPCLSDVFLDAGASRKKGALRASSTMGGPDMLTEDSESSGAAASGIVDLQEMITTLVLTFSAFFFFFFF